MVDSYDHYDAAGAANQPWNGAGQGQGNQDSSPGLDENNLAYEVEPINYELVDNKA